MRPAAFLNLQPLGLFCKPNQVFQEGPIFQPCVTQISVLELKSHAQYVPIYKMQCMRRSLSMCYL